jgi:hypothetical protein
LLDELFKVGPTIDNPIHGLVTTCILDLAAFHTLEAPARQKKDTREKILLSHHCFLMRIALPTSPRLIGHPGKDKM